MIRQTQTATGRKGDRRVPEWALILFQWNRVEVILGSLFAVLIVVEMVVTPLRKRII